ncbi:MAG: hypothetical protein ABS949_03510 [Solibacillus sp.]
MHNRERFIYVMFSSTPSKIGKIIRTVTKHPYNHVSLCLNADEMTVYSFARIYKNHPFYGGFVKESTSRFMMDNHLTQVKLCAIPVSEEQYEHLTTVVQQMEQDADQYTYNHLSIIGGIFKKKVQVKNAYTCVEFTTNLLTKSNALPQIDAHTFYDIEMLEQQLNRYTVYEGPFEHLHFKWNNHGDTFDADQSYYTGMYLAFSANARLVYSFIRST